MVGAPAGCTGCDVPCPPACLLLTPHAALCPPPPSACRVQLASVGALEKLAVSLGGAADQASWLLEQVEVTDEATGGRGRGRG